MKWKYIGNRAGDATKGEQYIVEADELTEIYMKEMPYCSAAAQSTQELYDDESR